MSGIWPLGVQSVSLTLYLTSPSNPDDCSETVAPLPAVAPCTLGEPAPHCFNCSATGCQKDKSFCRTHQHQQQQQLLMLPIYNSCLDSVTRPGFSCTKCVFFIICYDWIKNVGWVWPFNTFTYFPFVNAIFAQEKSQSSTMQTRCKLTSWFLSAVHACTTDLKP